MGLNYGPVYKSVSDIKGPSGWYTIRINNEPVVVYVDQSYSGGGWVMVLANNNSTGGMNNLTYNDAVNTCNYRLSGSPTSASNAIGRSLTDLNAWVGVKYWASLAGRLTSNVITVVQFVSSTKGTALSNTGAHTKRYRWSFTFSNATYSPGVQTYNMANVTGISDETGTGSPGFYSYHAVNGFPLTTYDNYGFWNGCATFYNNNPWWYGSCWSGNYFAGGGYANYPYWDSSGGDYHNYGAVYIK